MVTISHAAPYGIPDGAALTRAFFTDPNIDYVSPQLYSSGTESANDYTPNMGMAWTEYAQSKAQVVPSIVLASMYADAKAKFQGWGVNTAGYVQWASSGSAPPPSPPTPSPPTGADLRMHSACA